MNSKELVTTPKVKISPILRAISVLLKKTGKQKQAKKIEKVAGKVEMIEKMTEKPPYKMEWK